MGELSATPRHLCVDVGVLQPGIGEQTFAFHERFTGVLKRLHQLNASIFGWVGKPIGEEATGIKIGRLMSHPHLSPEPVSTPLWASKKAKNLRATKYPWIHPTQCPRSDIVRDPRHHRHGHGPPCLASPPLAPGGGGGGP